MYEWYILSAIGGTLGGIILAGINSKSQTVLSNKVERKTEPSHFESTIRTTPLLQWQTGPSAEDDDPFEIRTHFDDINPAWRDPEQKDQGKRALVLNTKKQLQWTGAQDEDLELQEHIEKASSKYLGSTKIGRTFPGHDSNSELDTDVQMRSLQTAIEPLHNEALPVEKQDFAGFVNTEGERLISYLNAKTGPRESAMRQYDYGDSSASFLYDSMERAVNRKKTFREGMPQISQRSMKGYTDETIGELKPHNSTFIELLPGESYAAQKVSFGTEHIEEASLQSLVNAKENVTGVPAPGAVEDYNIQKISDEVQRDSITQNAGLFSLLKAMD